MAKRETHRLRATLKNGRYHVVEGLSPENLKKKGKQLENEGASGYIERVRDSRVIAHFGKPATEVSHASAA